MFAQKCGLISSKTFRFISFEKILRAQARAQVDHKMVKCDL